MRHFRVFLVVFLLIFQVAVATEEERAPDRTEMIPMRDGVELPTDLYFPAEGKDDLPCILVRTPAGRRKYWKEFVELTKYGYVVAIQDTRSTLEQTEPALPFTSDGWHSKQDGYDAVEWLAKQPFTNGKVGTMGYSALGITQNLLAPSAPPSLKCQFICVAAASIYDHAMFPSGKFLKDQVEGWLGQYSKDENAIYYVLSQKSNPTFWEKFDALRQAHRVKVPGLHMGGWYDTFSQGTIDSFVTRQTFGGTGARGHQKLVMGPWEHFWPKSTDLGDFKVPSTGNYPPVDFSPKSWFDYHLKGEHNAIASMKPVTYYVMGPFDGSESSGNVWRSADKWPVPSEKVSLYLDAGGMLQNAVTAVKPGSLPFMSDPNHPVPTIGGRNLFMKSGPMDQRPIEEREDVLVFTTDTLTEDVEVTGRLAAELFLTSNQKSTDVAIRLTDVYPDGRSILIADGIAEVKLPSWRRFLRSGKEISHPVAVELDLWSTSIVFAKGHKIRISISGSNYPRFDKNLHCSEEEAKQGKCNIARNVVYFGRSYPSRMILPIVRVGDRWLVKN